MKRKIEHNFWMCHLLQFCCKRHCKTLDKTATKCLGNTDIKLYKSLTIFLIQTQYNTFNTNSTKINDRRDVDLFIYEC